MITRTTAHTTTRSAANAHNPSKRRGSDLTKAAVASSASWADPLAMALTTRSSASRVRRA
jgi:hypothetical protein